MDSKDVDIQKIHCAIESILKIIANSDGVYWRKNDEVYLTHWGDIEDIVLIEKAAKLAAKLYQQPVGDRLCDSSNSKGLMATATAEP